MKVDFYKHNLEDIDKQACYEVLSSTFLTTGSVVNDFENKFSTFLGVNHSLGVTSCTNALFLCLKGLGIKEGDEVIAPAMTFVATLAAIEHVGATPILVDAEPNTGNINAELIEENITKKTKAIIPVHLYGQMCDMLKIRAIADKYNLKVIEDAAHCVEGMRDNIKVAELGDVTCFSFYATKNLTCGEGGAIVTNNTELYEWLKKARTFGLSKNAAERYTKKYEHFNMEFLGYKFNMSNIQASLLVNQLERLNKYLTKKEELAQIYNEGFKDNSGIKIPFSYPNITHARHLYTIWVDPELRDDILHQIQDHQIGCAVNYISTHNMKFFKDKYGFKSSDYPIADKIGRSTITIPLYPKLKHEEIQYVIKTINKIISK